MFGMKLRLVFGMFIAFLVACINPENTEEVIEQAEKKAGVLAIRIDSAKVAEVEFAKLFVALSAEGEKGIKDTIDLSKMEVVELNRSYRGLVTDVIWTLNVKVTLINDSVFYKKTFEFETALGEDVEIEIDLSEGGGGSSEEGVSSMSSVGGISEWCNEEGSCGAVVDERDGQEYRWTKIGEQVWMAENLNYDAGEGSFCLGDDGEKCAMYGKLYTWEALMDGAGASSKVPSGVKGVCPEGWHLPSAKEWQQMAGFVAESVNLVGKSGNSYTEIGTVLKAESEWKYISAEMTGVGSDDFGFAALPGAMYNAYDGKFESDSKGWGYWWTTTAYFGQDRMSYTLSSQNESLREGASRMTNGYSVRCLQDTE